jgi:Uma2 family endonuclease
MEPSITDPTALTPAIAADAKGCAVVPFQAEDVPSLDPLITEDNTPVDNFFVEKQQRLLTEPLRSCWPGPGGGRPFIAASNVGVFFEAKNPALVPDIFLSLDVGLGDDLLLKPNRSYFCWLRGKVPDLMLEIVSDRTGGEESFKMQAYCRMRIPYYVIFDPLNHLEHGTLRGFRLVDRNYQSMSTDLFPGIGLGLRQWQGVFEDCKTMWLRWCDATGEVIPTGKEKNEQLSQQVDRLRDQLRSLGIDPSV